MKTLWTAVTTVLILNVLALIGGIGILYATGRLDGDRVRGIVETLKMTIEEEDEQQALAGQLEEQNRLQAVEASRLNAVRHGPVTLADQLKTTHDSEDTSLHIANRMRRDIADLQRQVEIAKQLIAKQRETLTAEREAFDEMAKRHAEPKDDQDFRHAVAMYEKLKPKMAKQMFIRLLNDNKTQQVVNYLAAMKMRKAAAVLNEFKSPPEIVQATELIQQLRDRGMQPVTSADLATNQPKPGAS